MSRRRALLRLAARDARRDGWRTVLVLVAVALPVFLLAGGILAVDTMQPTGEERATGQLGRADARATVYDREALAGTPVADLDQRVGPNVRLEPIVSLGGSVELDAIQRQVLVTDLDLGPDALAAGLVTLVEGRRAGSGDEVVISTALADLGDLAIGDTIDVEVADPGGESELPAFDGLTVVGIAERPEILAERAAYVAPGTLPHELAGDVLLAHEAPVPIAVAGDDVLRAEDAWPDRTVTWFVESREHLVAQRFPGGERTAALLLGGLAIVETALMAGAAFAVSVRRRQRELGLVAATGGRRRDVRRLVVWTGGVVSSVASVIGIALAVGALLATVPLLETIAGRRIAGPRIDPWWLLVVGLVGTAGGLLGAWLPARGVSRLPVTVALEGRRPLPARSRRTATAGMVAIVFGVGLLALPAVGRGRLMVMDRLGDWEFTALLLVGCVAIVLGAGLLSPTLLGGLGRLAPRLGVGWRLAFRDAARYRMRNGPLVTAALAALAASITLTSLLGSAEQEARSNYTPSHAEDQLIVSGPGAGQAATEIGAALGVDAVALPELGGLYATITPDEFGATVASVLVASPELVEALTADGVDPRVEPDEAILVGAGTDGLDVRWFEDDASLLRFDEVRELPGRGGDTGYWRLPAVLLPEASIAALADRLAAEGSELTTGPIDGAEHVLVLDGPVDDEIEAQARRIGAQVGGDELFISVERGFDEPFQLAGRAITGLGLLAGLAVVAIALALAATEGRRDLATMAAVGASRRTRLGLATGRAAVLSGLAAVLAVPVGMAPAIMLAGPVADGLEIVIPWTTITLVVIGVPLLAVAGAWLAARRGVDRIRLERAV
jgi:putative ABC transport system permease protein